MIAIIDYGMGNIGSIANMLKKIGANTIVSSDTDTVLMAEKLILPGVGSFDYGMKNLKNFGFIQVLQKKVLGDKTPILGICLGMQLMTTKSEEGLLDGLGWIQAETKRFHFSDENRNFKIPHMGWNTVQVCKDMERFNGIEHDPRFYFVHSYHAVCENKQDILTKTIHGYEFVSAFSHDNITGVQFHPEKSHKFGMNFLRNWVFS